MLVGKGKRSSDVLKMEKNFLRDCPEMRGPIFAIKSALQWQSTLISIFFFLKCISHLLKAEFSLY